MDSIPFIEVNFNSDLDLKLNSPSPVKSGVDNKASFR
jgi:hypothetical protein